MKRQGFLVFFGILIFLLGLQLLVVACEDSIGPCPTCDPVTISVVTQPNYGKHVILVNGQEVGSTPVEFLVTESLVEITFVGLVGQ